MRSSFLNHTMRHYLKWRYKRIEAIRKNPLKLQEVILKKLISQGQKTEWGNRHAFRHIRNIKDFKKQIPISKYERIQPFIKRTMEGEKNVLWPGKTEYFAKSSGTSDGKSKYIPISEAKLRYNQIQSGWDALSIYYHQNPKANIFTYKSMILCGAIENAQCKVGDVSAILLDRMPKFGRPYFSPDFETGLLKNWDEKLNIMANQSANDHVVMLAGVPSWAGILSQKMLKNTRRSHMQEIWPDFQLYYHGGISFEPYRKLFDDFFPLGIDYMEVYNASEGYIAIQDVLGKNDLLLLLDNGIFFEFLPLSEIDSEHPITVPLEDLEVGLHYAVVISCCGGLWRYFLGDTMQITSVFPFHCKVSGRTQHFINAFGEELMICNTDKAIGETCMAFGVSVMDYTVAPVFFRDDQKPGHQWLVEFIKEPTNLSAFSQELDLQLQKCNSDYEAKRYKNLLMGPLILESLPKGSFQRWMYQSGTIGAQRKIPRLYNTRKYVDELLSLRQKHCQNIG